jgi:hypothetical protein
VREEKISYIVCTAVIQKGTVNMSSNMPFYPAVLRVAQVIENWQELRSNLTVILGAGHPVISELDELQGKADLLIGNYLRDVLPRTEETWIDDLGLSARTLNPLLGQNITTVDQILDMTEQDLLKIDKFGKMALAELKQALSKKGYLNASNG